ncbi:hypothetical protein ACRAWD_09175 [Caulobacter segnis]
MKTGRRRRPRGGDPREPLRREGRVPGSPTPACRWISARTATRWSSMATCA